MSSSDREKRSREEEKRSTDMKKYPNRKDEKPYRSKDQMANDSSDTNNKKERHQPKNDYVDIDKPPTKLDLEPKSTKEVNQEKK